MSEFFLVVTKSLPAEECSTAYTSNPRGMWVRSQATAIKQVLQYIKQVAHYSWFPSAYQSYIYTILW